MKKGEPAKTESNKRHCIVCGEVFFAFPSACRKSCASEQCQREARSHGAKRHGMARSRLYNIWCGMKARVKGTSGAQAKRYYAGLALCSEWMVFESFRDWAMNNGYAESLEIDRIDNSVGYCPGNCRWATRYQQMQNTEVRSRKNKTSRFKGVQYLSHTKKKWRALASVNGKPIQIGLFATEEEAARAYDEWAKQNYREFASLNFKEVCHFSVEPERE